MVGFFVETRFFHERMKDARKEKKGADVPEACPS